MPPEPDAPIQHNGRGELKSARIIRHEVDSSLLCNNDSILKQETPATKLRVEKDSKTQAFNKDIKHNLGASGTKLNRYDSTVSLTNTSSK
jgi:hypothetical protein